MEKRPDVNATIANQKNYDSTTANTECHPNEFGEKRLAEVAKKTALLHSVIRWASAEIVPAQHFIRIFFVVCHNNHHPLVSSFPTEDTHI